MKCQEAALGVPPELQAILPPGEFIKCGKPASNCLWCNRDRRLYWMCDMCTDHNLTRGMVKVDMSKLRGFESLEEIIAAISEGDQGAELVCKELIDKAGSIDPEAVMGSIDKLFDLDIFDIHGKDIWTFYKMCRGDIALVCLSLRYVQLGPTEHKEWLKDCIANERVIHTKKLLRFLKRRLTNFKYEEIR